MISEMRWIGQIHSSLTNCLYKVCPQKGVDLIFDVPFNQEGLTNPS